MSLFDRLRKPPPQSPKLSAIPVIPTPEGYPDPARIAAPKKRGKPPEQYEAELAVYRQSMRDRFAAIARFDRERAMKIGCAKFVWRDAGVGGCAVAAKNGGKPFSYANPPREGFPAEGRCEASDWCRCYAEPIVPDFD